MWPMGLLFIKSSPVKQYSYEKYLAAYMMLCIKAFLYIFCIKPEEENAFNLAG